MPLIPSPGNLGLATTQNGILASYLCQGSIPHRQYYRYAGFGPFRVREYCVNAGGRGTLRRADVRVRARVAPGGISLAVIRGAGRLRRAGRMTIDQGGRSLGIEPRL